MAKEKAGRGGKEKAGGSAKQTLAAPFLGQAAAAAPSVSEFSPQGGLPLAQGTPPIGRKVGSTSKGERAQGSGLGHLKRNTLTHTRNSHPASRPLQLSAVVALFPAAYQAQPFQAR